MMSMNAECSSVAILSIEGSDYCCLLSELTKMRQ